MEGCFPVVKLAVEEAYQHKIIIIINLLFVTEASEKCGIIRRALNKTHLSPQDHSLKKKKKKKKKKKELGV